MMLLIALAACAPPDDNHNSPVTGDDDDPFAPDDITDNVDDDDDDDEPTDRVGTSRREGYALDQYLLDIMERTHLPGLAAALLRDGHVVWATHLGTADLDNGWPVTDETLFLVGSLSKTIIATAVMQLWDAGLVDLDVDVNQYLPFAVRHPRFPQMTITLRHLLTHTAGIRDQEDTMREWIGPGDSDLPLGGFLRAYLTEDGELYKENHFWDYPPGGRWKYSNIGASLAAYVVEEITGTPYAAYCKRFVFGPLGMTDSSYRLRDLDSAMVAMPYEYEFFPAGYLALGHYGMPYYPAGTVRTTAPELARVMIMMHGGGEIDGERVLSREAVAEIMRRPYPERWPHQGLLWYYGAYDGREVFGHQGGGMGVASKMFYRPEDGVGVVLLANGAWGGLWERLIIEGAMFHLFRAAERIGRQLYDPETMNY